MPRRAIVWVCSLITAALLVGSPAAVAQTGAMAFADDRPLTVKADELTAGSAVRLCNAGDRAATELDVEYEGFADEVRSALAPATETDSIPGGGCTTLTIKQTPRASIPEGAHSGIVVATSTAGIARRSVTIANNPPRTTIGSTPLLAKSTFDAERGGPGSDATLDGAKLAIKAPAPGKESLETPRPGTPLGRLHNGNHSAEILVGSGKIEKKRGAWYIPIYVTGAGEVGDYTGKIDPAGNGKPEEMGEVTVTVGDTIWWAAGAIILGGLLTIFLQLVLQRWRPQIGLWWHRWQLEKEYDKGIAAFNAHVTEGQSPKPVYPDFKRPSGDKIREYNAAVKVNVKAYSRSVVYFDVTSDAYKALYEAERVAWDDAKLLGSDDGLYGSLKALDAAVDELVSYIRTRLFTRQTPRLVRTAAALRKGKELKVGEATARAAKADDFVEFIAEWKASAEERLSLQLWLAAFVAKGPSLSEPDRALLERAAIRLAEARMELFAAEDRAALAKASTARELEGVYATLAFLGAKHHVSRPDPGELLTKYDADLAALLAERRLVMLEVAAEPPEADWKADAPDLFATPAAAGVVVKALRWVLDAMILLVSFAAGLAAGLATLYWGDDPFGTTEDYVIAILVGTTSQALTKGVLDALESMRAQDAGPEPVKKPEPSKVTAAA